MEWIWPEGLEPLWEDQPEEESAYFKSILEDIEKRYGALSDEERGKLLDTNSAGDIDRKTATKAAKDFLSRNRNSLADSFMNSSLVTRVLGNIGDGEDRDRKAKAMRAWLAQQLGRDDLGKASPMESELVKYYTDSRSGMLGSLPLEARSFIRRIAPVELATESALNSVAGMKSRETQGYSALLAVNPIEDSDIAAKERELASLLLANLSSGRGNVLDVISGEVSVPGFDDPSAWNGGSSLEDKVLRLLGDKFKESQFAKDIEQDDGWGEHQDYLKQHSQHQQHGGGAKLGEFRGVDRYGRIVEYDTNTGRMRTRGEIAKDKADKEAAEQAQRQAQSELSEYYGSRDRFLRGIFPDYEEVVGASEIETDNPNGAPLPEDWIDVYEYPIAIPYKGGMLVAVEDGDAPRFISGNDAEYKTYKDAMLSTLQKMIEGVSGTASQDDLDRLGKIVELLGHDVSDSRMKKRKQKGLTHVGRLGSFLSSGMFRIGE